MADAFTAWLRTHEYVAVWLGGASFAPSQQRVRLLTMEGGASLASAKGAGTPKIDDKSNS